MPKKPNPGQLDQWRRLRKEGKSFQEIGRATKWQARTVQRYLEKEGDADSEELRQVRRELFKERLGRHWDQLLGSVAGGLEQVGVPTPADGLEEMEQREAHWSFPGTRVRRIPQGEFQVQMEARELPEWNFLRQHLPRESIWTDVEAFEKALAASLQTRQALRNAVAAQLCRDTGLPVLPWKPEEPALTPAGVHQVVVAALSDEGPSNRPVEVVEDFPGYLNRDGQYIAYAPEHREEVTRMFQEAMETWPDSEEARAARKSYHRLVTAAERLRTATAQLRLFPYLPGTCSLCSGVAV